MFTHRIRTTVITGATVTVLGAAAVVTAVGADAAETPERTRTTTSRSVPPAQQPCVDEPSIDMGKYWINNNLWGKGSGSGSQCISAASTSGNSIAWSTRFNWSGQANTVKSYASSVLGWHWGVKRPDTGLPVQLSANRDITTKWDFEVTQEGSVTQNVSYDVWLHDKPDPTYKDQPTDELMIWLYRSNGAGPAGTKQVTVTIGDARWDVYKGVVGTWNVYSYVRTTNTTSADLNIRDFTQDVVSRGWMSTSKFLTSVQAGTEVFTGKGQVDTTSYSVDVQ